MSLKAKVFATHVSSLSDARYFAGMGAEFIAIQINPNLSGYLPPEKFKEIAGWITGPEFVLQVIGLNSEQIEKAHTDYGIDAILISAEQLNSLNGSGENIFIEINASEFNNLNKIIGYSGGNVVVINADLSEAELRPILSAAENKFDRIFLGNISTDKAADTYLNNFPAIGFAVSGTPEIKVGLKEYNFREFLEYLDSE